MNAKQKKTDLVPYIVGGVGVVVVIAMFAVSPSSPTVRREAPTNVVIEDAGAEPLRGDELPATYHGERFLMGTTWEITISGVDASNEERARTAVDAALNEVDRLENVLSEWRPDTEISRVNAQAGIAPVRIGPDLLACVKASLEVSRWSDGAFDISWAALRGLWDFSAQSQHIPPTEAAIREKLPLWNYRNIVLDEAASTLYLRQRGMAIGLGGVAKGYGLDHAADILVRAGFNDFIMSSGGQVLAHGHRGPRAWRVGIRHPRRDTYFAFLEVPNGGSISTSGDYEHTFEHDGTTYHHIIDPHTGFPSRASASVTLFAPTGLAADAVDTAAFILGPARAIPLLASAPGGPMEGVFVDPAMRVSATPGTERKLVMRAYLDAEHHLGASFTPDTDAGPTPPLNP